MTCEIGFQPSCPHKQANRDRRCQHNSTGRYLADLRREVKVTFRHVPLSPRRSNRYSSTLHYLTNKQPRLGRRGERHHDLRPRNRELALFSGYLRRFYPISVILLVLLYSPRLACASVTFRVDSQPLAICVTCVTYVTVRRQARVSPASGR